LGLAPGADKEALSVALDGHVLARSVLRGHYRRP